MERVSLFLFFYDGVVLDYTEEELKGLEKGLPRFLCGATMTDLGGKLCVVWECQGNGHEIEI